MSLGDRVRALRSRGGGIGLIRLARLWSPFFWESGDPDSEDRVGGLMEEDLDVEAEMSLLSFFFTERSSGMSCIGTGLESSSMASDSLPTSISSSSEQGSLLTEAVPRGPEPPATLGGGGNASVKAALNI